MATAMETLMQYIKNKPQQLSYSRTLAPQNYLGPTLFPNNTTKKLTWEYLKGARNRPVAATVQAFGAEASIASRRGMSKVNGEIPAIKRKIPLDGKTLMLLKSLNPDDAEQIINDLYNDMDNMVYAVHARFELMRMEAVSDGKVVLEENGVIATADYGVPDNHKETLSGTDSFEDTDNSKPLDVLNDWASTIQNETGIRPTRGLSCNRIIQLICKNKSIRLAINGDLGANKLVTLPQVNQLLASQNLPQLASYDTRIDVEDPATGDISSVRAFDNTEKKLVLLPPGALGESLWGPTEEAMISEYIDQKNVAGIWGGTYLVSNDPVLVETKASATAFPTFPMADTIFIGTVR